MLSLLVRRFNSKGVLKENTTTREAVMLVIDDPVEVKLDLVTS